MWDIEGVGLYQTEWKEKVIPDVQDGVLKKSGSVVQIRDEWREIVGETDFHYWAWLSNVSVSLIASQSKHISADWLQKNWRMKLELVFSVCSCVVLFESVIVSEHFYHQCVLYSPQLASSCISIRPSDSSWLKNLRWNKVGGIFTEICILSTCVCWVLWCKRDYRTIIWLSLIHWTAPCLRPNTRGRSLHSAAADRSV